MYRYGTPPNEPERFETKGNYADPESDYEGVEYSWIHSMGDIVNALIQAGLRIEFLHEHHFSVEASMWKGMERGDDGYYRFRDPKQRQGVPLMFSIRARKD
jgi:hypothetical protein